MQMDGLWRMQNSDSEIIMNTNGCVSTIASSAQTIRIVTKLKKTQLLPQKSIDSYFLNSDLALDNAFPR